MREITGLREPANSLRGRFDGTAERRQADWVKRVLIIVTLLVLSTTGCTASPEKPLEQGPRPGEPFVFRVLATGLADPWEIAWGPDGFLWVTEKLARQ